MEQKGSSLHLKRFFISLFAITIFFLPVLVSASELTCDDLVLEQCVIFGEQGLQSFECSGTRCTIHEEIGIEEWAEHEAYFTCNLTNIEKFQNITGELTVSWNVENIDPGSRYRWADTAQANFGDTDINSGWYYFNQGYEGQTCDEWEAEMFCWDYWEELGFLSFEDCLWMGSYYCTHAYYFNNLDGSDTQEFKLVAPYREDLAEQFSGGFSNGDDEYNDRLVAPVMEAELDFTECIPKVYPILKNITILPAYDSPKYTNRDNLTYEEIFVNGTLNVTANLSIEDPLDRDNFTVNYTMQFIYPELLQVHGEPTYIEGSAACSQECEIPFPKDRIKQDSLFIITARVYDDLGNSHPDKGNGTAYRYTPYFDVTPAPNGLEAGNVVDNVQNKLTRNKPIYARGLFLIESHVKRFIPGQDPKVFENYIDSVDFINATLYFNGVSKKTLTKKRLKRYEDMEELKATVIDASKPLAERRKAMLRLQEYKRANHTINFRGIFPNKDQTGNLNIKMVINPENSINEFRTSDNSLMYDTYTLNKQKRDRFNIVYVTVGFIEEASFWGNSPPAQRGPLVPSITQAQITNQVNDAHKYLLSAFPFDPTRVLNDSSGNAFQTYFPVYISKGRNRKLRDWNSDSEGARRAAIEQLQKLADTADIDLIYGMVHKNAMNSGGGARCQAGLTLCPVFYNDFENVALIDEMESGTTFAHEAGHLFGGYRSFEQWDTIGCKDPLNMFGLPSSNGVCMDQKTGKPNPCWRWGFLDPPNAININIFHDRDEDNCYNMIDGPKSGVVQGLLPVPGFAGRRKADIMAAEVGYRWPRNSTYKKLMNSFIV